MPNIPIDLRDLARERKSIAALAAHLLSDVHGGEDLAQESVYRLLRAGGPRAHGNRLAWLRTTVRRLAANEHRGRGSRQQREQEAARPEATLSSDQIAERAELCRRVHQAIDSLPRDQANVLRDHYFGELAASEIADRDGLSVNTVKSRIHRARAALREALERDGLGGDVHWSIALAPLVPSAPLSALPGAALASTLTGAAGAVLVMKKLVSFAVVLLALLVGVQFILPGAERDVSSADADLGSADVPALGDDAQLADAPSPVSARTNITPPAEPHATGDVHLPTTSVFGRVVDSDGWPLPDVLVQLSRRDSWGEVEVDATVDFSNGRVGFTAKTDREGKFHLRVPHVGSAPAILDVIPGTFRTVLALPFGANVEHELREGDVDVGDLTLAVAGAISGRVVDTDSAPIVGATLRVAPSLGTSYGLLGKSECKSGADGSFVLGHAPIGQYGLAVEARGFASRFVDDIGIRRDQMTDVRDVVLEPVLVALLRGRILDETGRGIPRQSVTAHPKTRGDRMTSTNTDDDGWFEIELKSTSPHMLKVERRGYEIVGGFLAKGPYRESTSDPITIQLTPLPRTTFKLVDAETDEAILVFGITVLHDCGAKAPKRISRTGSSPRLAHHPDGILVAGARAGVDLIRVNAEGYRPFKGEVEHDRPGERTQTIRLRAGASATGRVLLDGQPAIGASVVAIHRSAGRVGSTIPKATTAENGGFVLAGLIPGVFSITARSSDGTRSGEATLMVKDERELGIGEIDLLRTGSIDGAVLLPRGVNPEGLSVYLDDWWDKVVSPVSSTGTFHLRDVQPGDHRVTLVERPGELVTAPSVAVKVVPEQVTTVDIDARDCGMARVTLTIDIPGVSPENIRVHIVHDMVGKDAAQRERHRRSGITKMLEPDGVPGRVTGLERASGRALIELYLPGRLEILLPEPVLLLEPFGDVEHHVLVELGSLSIDFPESLTIPADARIEARLRQDAESEWLAPIQIWLADGVPMERATWGGASFAGRTLSIGRALPGKYELSVLMYAGSALPLQVTHADGWFRSSHEGQYLVTLPVECATGEVTHVSLPESPGAAR